MPTVWERSTIWHVHSPQNQRYTAQRRPKTRFNPLMVWRVQRSWGESQKDFYLNHYPEGKKPFQSGSLRAASVRLRRAWWKLEDMWSSCKGKWRTWRIPAGCECVKVNCRSWDVGGGGDGGHPRLSFRWSHCTLNKDCLSTPPTSPLPTLPTLPQPTSAWKGSQRAESALRGKVWLLKMAVAKPLHACFLMLLGLSSLGFLVRKEYNEFSTWARESFWDSLALTCI